MSENKGSYSGQVNQMFRVPHAERIFWAGLPFNLPDQVKVPGLAQEEPILYVLIVGAVLALAVIAILYALIIVLLNRRRMRRLASALLNTQPVFPVRPKPPEEIMDDGAQRYEADHIPGEASKKRVAYATLLDSLGAYLSRQEADNLCLGEIDGGVLLLYTVAGVPRVETLTPEQVLALSPSSPRGSHLRLLHQQLFLLGKYLDSNFAASFLIDQQKNSFYVEYTALPSTGQHSESELALVRVSRQFDETAITRLGTGPIQLLAR